MRTFTDDEVKAAKAVLKEMITMDSTALKSVYMAGEIVMWDELKPQQQKLEKAISKLKEMVSTPYKLINAMSEREYHDFKMGFVRILGEIDNA